MILKDWFSSFVLLSLCLFYFYLLATPINLATADLGRHIRNGEQLLSGHFDLLFKNYYSYTNPDFPFINHHWLGGVIFYLVWAVSGFSGVQLFFITIDLVTFILFFYIAKKYSNIIVCSILALLIIPLIGYRDEVRPEAFSYLFAGLYYLVLRGFSEGKIRRKWLFSLIPIQLVWANTHIYFFVGFFILGVFWLDTLTGFLRKKQGSLKSLQMLTVIGLLLAAVSLLNPHFINGLTYPFRIFGNYGYKVLENQSIAFLEKVISIPVLMYLKIVLYVMFGSWIYKTFRAFKYKENINTADLILSVVFSVLAVTQIRNQALFGFFSHVIIAANLKTIRLEASKYLLVPVLAIMFVLLLVINPKYWENKVFGLGLVRGIEKGAQFFTKESIKGPVFNNYDIGGYLIYSLYPGEKVFVDNRPEGYPQEFFTKIYVPMQNDEEVWKDKNTEYNFNSIFFYRQDLTPWAQKFLVARIKDPEWAAVFVDNYNIIFLKRNDQNAQVIKKYELPKEMFKID